MQLCPDGSSGIVELGRSVDFPVPMKIVVPVYAQGTNPDRLVLRDVVYARLGGQ